MSFATVFLRRSNRHQTEMSSNNLGPNRRRRLPASQFLH